MRNKKLYALIFILILSFGFVGVYALFTSINTNKNNYIQIGKISKPKPKPQPKTKPQPKRKTQIYSQKTILYDYSKENVTRSNLKPWLIDVGLDKGKDILGITQSNFPNVVDVRKLEKTSTTNKLILQINSPTMLKQPRDFYHTWKSYVEIYYNGRKYYDIRLDDPSFPMTHYTYSLQNGILEFKFAKNTGIVDSSAIDLSSYQLYKLRGRLTIKTYLDNKLYDEFFIELE